jgi:ATP-dependent RNA helicase DDX5/DBP2
MGKSGKEKKEKKEKKNKIKPELSAEEKAAKKARKKAKKEKSAKAQLPLRRSPRIAAQSPGIKGKNGPGEIMTLNLTASAVQTKKRKRADSTGGAEVVKKVKQDNGAEAGKTADELLSVDEFRKKYEIKVKTASNMTASDIPPPLQSFGAECAKLFNPAIMQAIRDTGFEKPSAIQAQAWPLACTGVDLIAVAKTGSGKTAGFLLPAFLHVTKKLNGKIRVARGDGPIVLCMAPTRELATQIETECIRLSKTSKLVTACVYGGMPKGKQIGQCMRGLHILIATPGRLNDLLEMNKPPVTNLKRCSFLILDEADRMLDMGFEPQIRSIIEQIPTDTPHQTMMFTATWPKAVVKLARDFLRDACQINIGDSDGKLAVNKSITHEVVSIPDMDKKEKLVQILGGITEPNASVIVFANRKKDCDQLAYSVRKPDSGRKASTATKINMSVNLLSKSSKAGPARSSLPLTWPHGDSIFPTCHTSLTLIFPCLDVRIGSTGVAGPAVPGKRASRSLSTTRVTNPSGVRPKSSSVF